MCIYIYIYRRPQTNSMAPVAGAAIAPRRAASASVVRVTTTTTTTNNNNNTNSTANNNNNNKTTSMDVRETVRVLPARRPAVVQVYDKLLYMICCSMIEYSLNLNLNISYYF